MTLRSNFLDNRWVTSESLAKVGFGWSHPRAYNFISVPKLYLCGFQIYFAVTFHWSEMSDCWKRTLRRILSDLTSREREHDEAVRRFGECIAVTDSLTQVEDIDPLGRRSLGQPAQ